MKTQIGVGVAVLSALAAEGKNFDRNELNAMLDKLAVSCFNNSLQRLCFVFGISLNGFYQIRN